MPREDIYSIVEEDYNHIDLSFHNAFDTTREYRDQIASFASSLLPGAQVLNVGGTLVECRYFADRGFAVTDVDISKAMLGYIAEHDARIRLVKANARDVRGPFDGIWACRSLIHVPPDDLPDTLRNLHAALLPHAIAGLVFFTGEKDVLEQRLPERHARKPVTYYRVLYSEPHLLRLLSAAGLHVLRIERITDDDGDPSVYVLCERG